MTTLQLTSGLLSVTSVITIVLSMRKVWWAPIFGLAQQAIWIWFVFAARAYPLFVGVAAYTLTFALAIRKWYRERPRC